MGTPFTDQLATPQHDASGSTTPSEFFTDEANMAELLSHMAEDYCHRFNKWGHLRVEPIFLDRILVVYKATGLTRDKKHRDPEVLTTLRVKTLASILETAPMP